MMCIVCVVCVALYIAQLATKAVLARRYARSYPRPPVMTDFSEATILQPILGGDPALAATLATNVARLPGATFVWLLDRDDAAGWDACRRAAAQHVDARITLVETPPLPAATATNPKLFKLAHAEPDIGTRVVVVLDDDTRLTREGLAALIDALRDHDVATGLPFYLPGENIASKLVAQFVNNQGVLLYLPTLVARAPITLNGMAYALETRRLRELGGFAPLVHRLTDDRAIARLVLSAGGRIRQTIFPHETSTTVRGLRHYAQLMHRWFVFALLLVRDQPPGWRALILALHGVPPLLLWCGIVAGVAAPGWWSFGIVIVLVLTRLAIVASVQRAFYGHAAHEPLWSLVVELLQPAHLAHALVVRRIRWRSRVIDVRADDDFSCR